MKTTRSMVAIQAIELKRLTSYPLDRWLVLVLFSLATLILLWGLGKSTLYDWDEAMYAQISKEIVQSGNWLTLHWEHKPYLRKPPVFMWSTAVFFRLFGVNEFWSRAASAFSGIALVIITYLVGKFVYNKWVGFFAAIVLLTSYQFVDSARFGTTDIMLTLFTFLAIYAYLRLEKGSQGWWYVIWISCALALMIKSAAGLIAPTVITLSLLLDRRLIATTRSRHFRQGLLLACLIVVPWHIIMYVQHGQAFLDQYFGHSILNRSTTVIDGHVGGRFFYIDALQEDFFPWFYLLPFTLALSIGENLKSRSRSRILLLVFILVFGLITLAKTKLQWYILPLYPALAILTASMIVQVFNSYQSVAFCGLLVAAVVVALAAPVKLVLIFGCIGLLTIFLFLVATKKFGYQLAAVLMCTFFVLVGISELRPLYHRDEEPVAKLARIAGETYPNTQEPLILASGLEQPTALFYSNRLIQEESTPEDIEGFTKDHQTKEIILAKHDIESLSADYEIRVRAEAEPFVYATIRTRSNE